MVIITKEYAFKCPQIALQIIDHDEFVHKDLFFMKYGWNLSRESSGQTDERHFPRELFD